MRIQWNSLLSQRFIIGLYLAAAIFASIQALSLTSIQMIHGGRVYNGYNNYTIFKQSWFHLIEHKDLYAHYMTEQWDLYKYSPTFSFLFGAFASLPDSLGLSLWNLINSLIIAIAVCYLPQFSWKQKGWILIACLIESLTSMQNEQSNGLIAGLIILAFGLAERDKIFWAIGCIVLSLYIKIFGVVAMALFLFYPQKWRAALYFIFWMIFLFLLPLVVVEWYQLKFLYFRWNQTLAMDHSASYGLSVMGWLESWFGVKWNKTYIAAAGAVLFMIPMAFINRYRELTFRLLALCSVLIWIVIFNHKAESPTFIIAMAGVAIWFFIKTKPDYWDIILFVLAIILTSFSPSDLFPKPIRKAWVEPYVLKALPCILIWGKIWLEMVWYKHRLHPAN